MSKTYENIQEARKIMRHHQTQDKAPTHWKEIGTYYWGNTNITTFLYGTDLTRVRRDEIRYNNHLTPPGTPLHEWYSATDYQKNRDIPMLPFLYEGKSYTLEPEVSSVPEHHYIFEVLFYDRYEHKVGQVNLRAPNFSFEYPEEAYTYSIRLTAAGLQELTFHYFKIYEEVSEAS